MAFPQSPLDVHVDMQLGGAWTQIQAAPTGVRGADNIVITRGRADEQAQTSQQPGTAVMSLNNRDGRYSPRNPTSPYYGQLGRNTPIRISTIGDGTTYCRVPGNYGQDYASCPDASGLHVTGDIDIRIDVTLDNPLQYQTLAVKGDWGNGAATNLAWILYIQASGQLRFRWSTDGSSFSGVGSASVNLSRTLTQQQVAIRVTLSVATGTVTFYTAPNISGSWTQLGTTTVAGATSIFAGTGAIQLGEIGTNAIAPNQSIFAGRLNAFQLLSGIGGTVKASPSFSSQAVGTTSFADAQSNTWTLHGAMEITNRRYRFFGEVSSFPQKWDVSGTDIFTPIEAAGILRRYGQGTAVVASPIRRAVTVGSPQPIVYWPCEDAAGTASFAVAAGSSAARPMLINGTPTLATDTHIGGSSALPTLGNSTWTGTIPPYAAANPNAVTLSLVVYLNSAPSNGAVIARLVCGNTRADLAWSTSSGGGFYVNCYDTSTGSLATGATDHSGNPYGAGTGTAYVIQFQLTQSGTSVTSVPSINGGSTSTTNDTMTSRTLGQMTQVVIDPGGALTDTVVGHVAAYAAGGLYPAQLPALTGNSGETAGYRFVRLCFENGVQPRTVGDIYDSPAMGPQTTDTFLNLIQACIDADNGMLFEPRDLLGLGIYMRSALMSQTPAATINYSLSQLSAVPEPIDDDQLIRNDITVTRLNGSFARATLVTGTLSVNNPPNGVGTYSDTPTINFQSDSQLLDEASWRLHASTVDESRWPVITTGMHTYEMSGNPTLAQQVQRMDVGNVLTLTGLPAWLPPSDTRQLVQGITETLSNFEFTIAFNCSPASPYDVLFADDAVFGRLDTDGSTLHATVTSAATSWTVDTTLSTSPLWTTSAGDFPFDVSCEGEQVTVTNITGSSSPQTFTVTRSVNGVVKAHSSGAAISLQRPFYVGI